MGREAGDPAEEKKLVPTIVLECASLFVVGPKTFCDMIITVCRCFSRFEFTLVQLT